MLEARRLLAAFAAAARAGAAWHRAAVARVPGLREWVLRADYLAAIRAAGLVDVEILKDGGFGAVVLDMVLPSMREKARTAGIDVERTAETVRSLTIRARKPR